MITVPNYLIDAFHQWLVDGTPEVTDIKQENALIHIPAVELLRQLEPSTDAMPAMDCELVAGTVGFLGDGVRTMTYNIAANALLISRTAGTSAAREFLAAVLPSSASGSHGIPADRP